MANCIDLDILHAAALGAALFWLGGELKKRVRFIPWHSVPVCLIGGLVFALLNALLYETGLTYVAFDPTLQSVLMDLFFAAVGLGVSLSPIWKGEQTLNPYLIPGAVLNLLQTCIGAGVMLAMGQDPRLGMALNDIIGGPITDRVLSKDSMFLPKGAPKKRESRSFTSNSGRFIKAFLLVLFAGGLGNWIVSIAASLAGAAFSSHLGGMLVAVVLRNGMDLFAIEYPSEAVDSIGDVCATLFLTMTVMSIKLWDLAALLLPILVCLAAQNLLKIGVVRFLERQSHF